MDEGDIDRDDVRFAVKEVPEDYKPMREAVLELFKQHKTVTKKQVMEQLGDSPFVTS